MTYEQILSLILGIGETESFVEFLKEESRLNTFEATKDWLNDTTLLDEDTTKIVALMEHTKEEYEECKSYYEDKDYLVLTDDEANEAWEESLNNYLEECVLAELPDNIRNYFDDEKWITDAKYDGRGHILSPYNGEETEININKETFYIYRCN